MLGRGRNQRNKVRQLNKGTSHFGVCICPQCNYSTAHKRGTPCASLVCPKCHIPLLRQGVSVNRNPQTAPVKTTKSSSFPIIDTELCIGCGACIEICPADAIVLKEGKAEIRTEKCKKCKACINSCPVNAIT